MRKTRTGKSDRATDRGTTGWNGDFNAETQRAQRFAEKSEWGLRSGERGGRWRCDRRRTGRNACATKGQGEDGHGKPLDARGKAVPLRDLLGRKLLERVRLDVVKDRVTSLKTRRCGFESHLVKVRTSGATDSTPKYPDRLFPSGVFGAALNSEGRHRRGF